MKALIDLKAFVNNLGAVRHIVGPDVDILPVIKANGYGHGVVPLARESLKFGAPILGLGTLEEGIELRRAKIVAPILLLDGILKEDAGEVFRHKLTPVLTSMDVARELNRIGRKKGKSVPVHLKFDTGMSRLGFGFDESDEVIRKVSRMKNIKVEGIMTHLASSNDKESPQSELQLSRFDEIVEQAKEAGMNPKWIHAANSYAIINFKESRYSMVRPGIILYDPPSVKIRGTAFKPVMTLTSRLMSIKTVPAGEGIGYGATYITPRPKRIGVVMGGYADGVNRLLSNRGSVEVRGKLSPIVGTICMDNFMVDLSRLPAARVGDEVTLLDGNHNTLSASSWAELTGTISYEIFCRIGNRAERIAK